MITLRSAPPPRRWQPGRLHVVYNAGLERVVTLLDGADDDQDVGLGQIMLGHDAPLPAQGLIPDG